MVEMVKIKKRRLKYLRLDPEGNNYSRYGEETLGALEQCLPHHGGISEALSETVKSKFKMVPQKNIDPT